MNKPRSNAQEALTQTASHFHKKLQIKITNAEMQATFKTLSGNELGPVGMRKVRDQISAMREQLIERLADRLGSGNDVEPPYRVISAALKGAGFPDTRQAVMDIQARLRQKHGERWARSKERTFLRALVTEGESEMWEKLRQTYDLDNSQLLSMLLRTFVLAASTGRIDYIDTPGLAVSLSDDDLRRSARAMNFKIPLRRRF